MLLTSTNQNVTTDPPTLDPPVCDPTQTTIVGTITRVLGYLYYALEIVNGSGVVQRRKQVTAVGTIDASGPEVVATITGLTAGTVYIVRAVAQDTVAFTDV
jgi:hypothetical protein